MRHGQFHEVHRLARKRRQIALALEDHRIIAVGIVADDQRGRIDTPARRNGKRVHVGGGHAIELTGGVLVDRLDIVVDLHDLDIDAVFVGPFVHDAAVFKIAPRHPADIDRPRDPEISFLLRDSTGRKAKSKGSCGYKLVHFRSPSGFHNGLTAWRASSERGSNQRSSLPGFCPAVYCSGLTEQRYLSDQTVRETRNPRHPASSPNPMTIGSDKN